MAAGDKPPCDFWGVSGTHTTALGVTMEQFARHLSGGSVGRNIIIDDTKLEGRFDIGLDYARDPLVLSDLPGILTALQEQLGLKLESREGPEPFVVVDRIERPTPD